MKIRRSQPTIKWTQVPNVVVRDYRISWRARGLLVELLSYPPGWETTIDDLVRRAQRSGGHAEGRDAMRAAARELKAVGYLVAHKYQDERGRWHTSLEVTDAPFWDLLPGADDEPDTTPPPAGNTAPDAPAPSQETPDAPQTPETHVSAGRTEDGFPGVGSPGVGSPGVGFPGVYKKTETKTEKKTKNNQPPPPAPPHTDAPPVTEEGEEGQQPKETPNPSAEALTWIETLPWRRRPGRQQREHLAALVATAWAAGWTPRALHRELVTELEGVRSLYAVWKTRLQDLAAPPTLSAVSVDLGASEGRQALPPRCDDPLHDPIAPHDRFLYPQDGLARRCPRCHPKALAQADALTA